MGSYLGPLDFTLRGAGWYNEDDVRHALRLLLVALLVFNASGAAELLETYDCPPGETSATHQTCPPTCVRCNCCFQAAEVTSVLPVISVSFALARFAAPHTALPHADDREILHVPKVSLV